jgi:hypothetical protein
VSARLALAVTQTSIPTTRQGGDVVQSTSVREINLLRKIPFGIPENGSKITVDDIPKSLTESGMTYQYDKSNLKVFFSKEVILVPGTASFLVYGRAAPKGNNAQNGVLQTTITPDGYPADISFSLKQICATTDVPNDAKAIAAYLNRIANAQATIDGTTYSWKNSTNALLKLLYTNFTGLVSLQRQLPYLLQLNSRHRLLVVFFEDVELKEFINKSLSTLHSPLSSKPNTEDYYHHVMADRFAYEQRLIVSTLRQYGILSLLTTPDNLSVDVINRYLEMKARQQL